MRAIASLLERNPPTPTPPDGVVGPPHEGRYGASYDAPPLIHCYQTIKSLLR
jgi:hypothetical protein